MRDNKSVINIQEKAEKYVLKVRACNEKRIRMSECDGCDREKERKIGAKVDGQNQARLEREGTIERRGTRPGCLQATGQTHGLHIKVGKDADEEERRNNSYPR